MTMLKSSISAVGLLGILQLMHFWGFHPQNVALTVSSPGVFTLTANPEPDGTFNGFDIYFVNHPPRSLIHCVGENYDQDRSWLFRSCEYETLCVDIDTYEFVTFRDLPLQLPGDWWSSTHMSRNETAVAGGSQPRTWFPVVAQSLSRNWTTRVGQFRPYIAYKYAPSGYYRFNATMLPFYRHPTSFRNPGHLLWDDFLPLYNLLDMFDKLDSKLFLAHMRRPTTSEFQEPIRETDIIKKFLPVMGDYHNYNVDISKGFELKLKSNISKFKENENRVVCADYGLTGGGLLSDHGEFRWHGQTQGDYDLPHNTGRGGLFRRYRRFMMKNLGLDPDTKMEREPYQILVSQSSSSKKTRSNITFSEHVEELNKGLGRRVNVIPVFMARMGLREQIELTSRTTVYITTAGGGSASAFFLPRGAHLIVFYWPYQFLDWDMWNNIPDIKVHWLPIWRDENGTLQDLNLPKFVNLISRELDVIDAAYNRTKFV